MEKKYHICFAEGGPQGPYSVEEFKAMELNATTLVWREGFEKWLRLDNVEELSELWNDLADINNALPPRVPNERAPRDVSNSMAHKEVTIKYDAPKMIKHGIPAIVSFFIPGLGQILKGHIGKAVLIWLLSIVSIVLLSIGGVLGGTNGGGFMLCLAFIGAIGIPIIFIWNVYDAYNSN